MEQLKFDELGSAAQERFFNHARLLIEKEYVKDTTLEALAEQIYDNYIAERFANSPNLDTHSVSRPTSFLNYDKEKVWATPDLKEDDNWLK